MDIEKINLPQLLDKLNSIGIALSSEKNHERLLEMILVMAKDITNADGGTLYSKTEDNHLKFEIMHTDSLNIHMGGLDGESIPFPPIPLYKEKGEPNIHNVAACAVLRDRTINIPDAYASEEFDFSGTRNFDQNTGYRSQSFLTVPMKNHENEIIGVLQLINSTDPESGEVNAFSLLEQQLVESLSSQAAVSITNRSLIDAQKALFDSLIKLIADAIDEKSPYTAGHCHRVPVLTNMLANAACNLKVGPLKDFRMSEEEKYELDVAAWLHDCGKITTPEYVVDKGTKLETIFDRIKIVDTRFEVVKRDAIINYLKQKIDDAGMDIDEEEMTSMLSGYDEDRDFIRGCNIGGEVISDETIQRIDEIAGYEWQDHEGNKVPLLSQEEVENLKIARGTLNMKEREIINNHVSVTIKMLKALPYPKHLQRVPEYAGGHHEKMDGSGYPGQLKREDMSIPARMVAIADVFEALTARDRPYKKAMPLSQALSILGRMRLDNHIDSDLFDAFVWEKVYVKYAEKYLDPSQINEVVLEDIPGYRPPPSA